MKNCIAYVAGTFPTLSETFVYREVRALRLRGWTVQCVSLNEPPTRGQMQFNDLEANLIVVYSAKTFLDSIVETLRHPIRATKTMLTALGDAISPGERAGLLSRVKLLPQVLFALGLARQLRREDVEHLHCHFAHAPASVGMYAARQLGAGFSFTGHANDIFQRRTLLKRKLQRADFVSCISNWHREFYQSIAPEMQGKLQNVRCGVDVNGWTHANGARARSSGKLRVLTICRLVYKKGVDTLIRALAEIEDRGWKLTIAGDGPDRKQLESLAKTLGCKERVNFLGPVDNARVPQLLAEADVFVLPCRTDTRGDRDGIPVVLMEAMACRVPVVSGDLPAIRELIENGSSGFLVGGEDVKSLTKRLRELGKDEKLRERLAMQGRQRVVDEFSLDMNVSRLENALKKS